MPPPAINSNFRAKIFGGGQRLSYSFFLSLLLLIISIIKIHLLERGLDGSAAMVGKPVADVTVENVMFDTRGLEVCKKRKLIV
jgi:hypothetical protein